MHTFWVSIFILEALNFVFFVADFACYVVMSTIVKVVTYSKKSQKLKIHNDNNNIVYNNTKRINRICLYISIYYDSCMTCQSGQGITFFSFT